MTAYESTTARPPGRSTTAPSGLGRIRALDCVASPSLVVELLEPIAD